MVLKNFLLTAFRHVAGAIASWVVAWAAQKGVVLDPASLIALMLAAYALTEKALKPVTSAMGEIQPGDVSAETTAQEKLRAGH